MRKWLLLAVGFLPACSDSTQGRHSATGGAGGSAAAGSGGGAGVGGRGAGGSSGAPGNGGTAPDAGDAGSSEPPLVDPQADEACAADPNPANWSEQTLSFGTAGVGWVHAAVGGDAALLAAFVDSDLYVATSVAGGAWTEPVVLSTAADPFYRPLVRVGSDGQSALVLWAEEDDSVRYATWSGGGSFSAPEVLDGIRAISFSSVDAVVLPRSVAVLAWGASGGLHVIDDAGHAIDDTAPLGLSRRLFLGSGEHPVLYVTPSLGPANRHEYTIGVGFGAGEPVPPMAASSTPWQEFWFEAPSGRAARVVRRWSTPEAEGLHVTVRRGADDWSDEERITTRGAEDTVEPAVTAAGDEVLVVWEDAAGLVERGHVTNWSAERPLPRSRDVEIAAIAGAGASAGLVGSLRSNDDALTKLFRRGQDGTWYCPRLARHGSNQYVTGEPGGELLFAGGRGTNVHVVRFRP